jgi:hypothetical protein
MEKFLLAICWAIGTYSVACAQDTISLWNFNEQTALSASKLDSVTFIGDINASYATNGSSNYALNTKKYPKQGTDNQTAGLQLSFNTLKYKNIKLNFDIKLSSTASAYWAVLVNGDITSSDSVWHLVKIISPEYSKSAYIKGLVVDLSSCACLNNAAHCGIRIVSSYAEGATEYSAYASASSYGTTGTVKWDNVAITGTTVNDVVAPSFLPSNIIVSSNSGYAAKISWTKGEGAKTLIVVSESELEGLPADGISYAYNIDYENDLNEFENGAVIYNDTASSCWLSGLNPGTEYYISAFAQTGNSVKYSKPVVYSFVSAESDQHPLLFINELMADNTNGLQDGNAQFEDWIELYNPNDFDVYLVDYYVSNDSSNLTKYQLSSDGEPFVVQPKSYKLLWCDRATSQGADHVGFELSKAGAKLLLTAPDGETIIDQIIYPALEANMAFGRSSDGASLLGICKEATPLKANKGLAVISENCYTLANEVDVYPTMFVSGQMVSLSKPCKIDIYNIQGRKIKSELRANSIQTNGWNSGLYFVKINDNQTFKLVCR